MTEKVTEDRRWNRIGAPRSAGVLRWGWGRRYLAGHAGHVGRAVSPFTSLYYLTSLYCSRTGLTAYDGPGSPFRVHTACRDIAFLHPTQSFQVQLQRFLPEAVTAPARSGSMSFLLVLHT